MIKIQTLTLKNFLSVGAVTQSVNFDNQNLTLILGENLDLGGDGAKNGTGKTSILQGLSYALFGSAINSIKRDNLINRTNGKAMVVTVAFTVDDVEYRIERGRKPTFLKFFVNNQELESEETNDSQGDSRETQDAIERVLMMSSDMFRHIVGLNTYNEPFLALKANDQRTIIEQLLGITILSEKAETIKALNKQTKDEITVEQFRIRAVEEANKRIQEQIEGLQRRQRLWLAKHDEDLNTLVAEYDGLNLVDIASELQAHKDHSIYLACLEKKNNYDNLVKKQSVWKQTRFNDIKALGERLAKLNAIDIDAELQAHRDLAVYKQEVIKQEALEKELKRINSDLEKEIKLRIKLGKEITTLTENKCYACNQDFHDDNHSAVMFAKTEAFDASVDREHQLEADKRAAEALTWADMFGEPVTHYATESEAIKHSYTVINLKVEIENLRQAEDPYELQILDISTDEIVCGEEPTTHYKTESEAIKHSSRVESLLDQIANKHSETDPYAEQLDDMTKNAVQEISWDRINELTRISGHQEYLIDLLTNKKSFVRKKIIEQNLSYLNQRLAHYLDALGLPHNVLFMNDLSVEITDLGRPLDFDNCSRGERTRIILGLSFAFRDVWESLYSSVNLLFIDELVDNGLDTIGVENSIHLLKDMTRRRNKSVFLVSHRDELTSRVGSVLKVVKDGGFTSYEQADELVT
jgi:DNA repair exonuclease SbcCD ATPase subunit